MENLKIKSVYRFDKNEIEYLNEKYQVIKIVAVCFLGETKFTLDEKGNVRIIGEAAYGAFDKEQWKDVKRIVNGKKHIVGLKNDGTVVAYGDNSNGQCNVADWKDVIFIDTNGDKTIGFTKSHVMLETKKEEVILPEVQIPTTDDTEKEEVILPEVQIPTTDDTEKTKPLAPYLKTDNKEKNNTSNSEISATSDNISNEVVKKPNTKAVIIAIIAVLVVAGIVGAVVAGNSNSVVKNNESSTNSISTASSSSDYNSTYIDEYEEVTIASEGKCGENATYRVSEDTLYIEGTGTIKYARKTITENYESDFKYLEIKNVVISEGITEIGEYTFEGCSSLENITIPSSVITIGSRAFQECTSLESITIPSSVTEIGEFAFRECSSLESITIPSSVTEIGSSAFEYCKSLESITIPSSVTEIGSWAFDGCTSLESITIPSSVTKIGYGAFYRCTSLESITIPSSVTEIGYKAFYRCSSLKSITIPSSVTEIDDTAFEDCDNVTIHGEAGSYAETYAESKNITFKSI